MLKEDFTPAGVRKVYFWLAPAIAMIPRSWSIAVIPFGSQLGHQKMVIADLNVGILYTFGIVSLGVYGIVLAGYAANSKYPFLGGIRSSAQMISYEIAMGMSVIPLFLIVGNLNLSQIIGWQAHHGWLIFTRRSRSSFSWSRRLRKPTACRSICRRRSRNWPAAINVEYSSMKFALFFLGEYANMIASAAMMVTLFLGGWTLPFWGLDQPAATLGMGLAHILVFLAKMLFVHGAVHLGALDVAALPV